MKQNDKTLWEERYERSLNALLSAVEINAPKVMVRDEAQLLLEACYEGPWKTIWALLKHQLGKEWSRHVERRFEPLQKRRLRRVPDPVLEIAEREADEEEALREMVNSLD